MFAGAGLAVLAAGSAHAAVISLDFENITPYPSENSTFIENFYNGGTSSIGTSGTNYGIEFSSNALSLCLNTGTDVCSNGSHGGLGVPGSERGALFFLDGAQAVMNSVAGFDTGFAVNYAAPVNTGAITIWSGLNGTGSVLGTLSLGLTQSSCGDTNAQYCPFVSVGLNFSGEAHSVTFAGVANYIAFDDVTFGSATTPPVTPVPEPETYLLMLAGVGLTGFMARRRKARA
jgi:hypothetical protein